MVDIPLQYSINGVRLVDHRPNGSTYIVDYVYCYSDPNTGQLTAVGIPPKVGNASVPMTDNGDGTLTLNLAQLCEAALSQEGLTPGEGDAVFALDGSKLFPQ